MSFARVLGLVFCVSFTTAACGGGDDNGLTGTSTPATGGSSGTAGTSGSGGTIADASAGTGGAGGSSGTSGSGGTAGTAGGSAGEGGSAGCPGGCDDFIDCTIDSCVQNVCKYALGPCPPGLLCDVTAGCIGAPACASVDNCLQQWANDPCKANIRCDAATATCAFDLLDTDGDQHAPIVCGGDDCDDSDADRNPTVAETCDGKDNDCDGSVDDGATCGGGLTCQGGVCACPPTNACGSECVDKNTSVVHCGECNHPCPIAASCVGGVCQCPGSQAVCGASCVNTQNDPANCGTCGNVCGLGFTCTNGTCNCPNTVCANACVNTQTDAFNCGGCGTVCPAGATCQSGGCVCPPATPSTCDNRCVNVNTDNEHCGQCNNACAYGTCQGGQCPVCFPGGMLILMDTSGSMSTNSRLQSELAAVQTFVQELESADLSVGVQYFPRDSGSASLCNASDYANPDVAIGLLPGNAAAIVASMAGKNANYTSVIIGPLEAGINTVRAWESANPPRPGAVVMINDGGMNIGCTTETVAQAVAIAAAGFNGSPSVATHVIGVGDDAYATDLQWWSQVPAAAGGTLTQTHSLGTPAILDALRSIRATLQCP